MANTSDSNRPSKANSSAKGTTRKLLQLTEPPFPSPTKGRPVKRLKIEQSQKASHKICFERVGNKTHSYIMYVQRPNKDGGYIHPIQQIVTAETEQGDNFKKFTNALAPLVSRRISRKDNTPMPQKNLYNLKKGEIRYPFSCLYCEKNNEIGHEQYVMYVMGLMKEIINKASTYKTEFIVENKLSDATKDGPRPLDHVITDKGIQTILYRYYFMDHLSEDTYDQEKQIYEIPEDITKTFFENHQDVAHNFFSPYEGAYSEMAQSFGFPEKVQE